MSKTKSKGRKGSKTDPMESLPSKPRLCTLSKGSGGYGFNLHGEKGKHGQYIRAVDPGSPADVAGVKPGDRVIEVSGTNIERETHSQVVARIRADGGTTTLLVADRELDAYCKEHNITIKDDMVKDKEPVDDDDDPPHVNGINGSVDAVVEIEQKSELEEERIEAAEEQREESQPEVIAIPDPEPEPEPEEAQEPEEIRPYENDVGEDEEIVAATQEPVVEAEPPQPEREPTPEPEPEREPTPEPPREPTPPPPEPEPVREPTPPPPEPEPVREPTPPPPEPVREPTPPPPEPVREPTPPPPEPVREPTPPPPEPEEVDAPVPLPETKVSAPPARPPAPKVDLDLSDMAKARALAAGQRKKKAAAQQDWRSKYNAFNQL